MAICTVYTGSVWSVCHAGATKEHAPVMAGTRQRSRATHAQQPRPQWNELEHHAAVPPLHRARETVKTPPQHPRQSRGASTPPPRGEYRQQDVCHYRPRAKPYAASAVSSPCLATLGLPVRGIPRSATLGAWLAGVHREQLPVRRDGRLRASRYTPPIHPPLQPQEAETPSPAAAVASTRAPTGCQSQLEAPRD
jgi:hypothetical protein